MKEQLRLLPAVHMIQADPRFKMAAEESDFTESGLTVIVQDILNDLRERILNGEYVGCETKEKMIDLIFQKIGDHITTNGSFELKPVINATGVVIHTNLGRSRLSEDALKQMNRVARHYSNLEYNLSEGKRGSRHDLVDGLLQDITGAEAAMVVNNNAAAVFLVLRALAKDRSVVVSRGELVEIGGSFRVSSIMEESGAHLTEVGTTNKTHLHDYDAAIDEWTAMLMKVHTSNFKVVGFTDSVQTEKLVELASRYENLLTYEDLGSGALYDFEKEGIGDEPLVSKVIATGVDLITFSGDKLLGGPQCGVIAGKKALIDKLKKHQLARVLRVDKFTLAALEATLVAYKYGQIDEIPTVRDILRSAEDIKIQAERFISKASKLTNLSMDLLESTSRIGGGTMPEVELPTYVVSVRPERLTSEELFNALRSAEIPVIGRIKEEQVILDLRTVTQEEEDEIIRTLESISV
ncbi:L-seryl-tRNA(Sec) selenium transferase [Pseudalkalibacillus sp. SCS-8]|uniref:L-seryl-tRNA(Sec) selenium transferase n=1 Tax=Pseudalkalibacillus nanhaiensis TaxID=3115291 RepID=UPI0032DB1F6B